MHGRNKAFVTRFGDYLFLETGLLVDFHLEGNPLFYIFVGNLSGELGDNDRVIRIPLVDYIALVYQFSIFLEDKGTIRNIGGAQYHTGVRF